MISFVFFYRGMSHEGGFHGGVFALPMTDVIIQWPLNPNRLALNYQGIGRLDGDYYCNVVQAFCRLY